LTTINFEDPTTPSLDGAYRCDADDRVAEVISAGEELIITSPGYPDDPYLNDQCRDWIFSSLAGTQIQVEITDFQASNC